MTRHPVAPSVNVDATPDPPVVIAPMFRGQPIDTRPTGGHGPPTTAGRFQSLPDNVPARPLFDSANTAQTGPLTRLPTRMHQFSAEVTFGAESFEDCMCQFMCDDAKFKDFCKASIPKFDSSKNDLFVHWYNKLFCSTCLICARGFNSWEMVDLATCICPREGFFHVRVDLHRPHNSRIHFSEWLLPEN